MAKIHEGCRHPNLDVMASIGVIPPFEFHYKFAINTSILGTTEDIWAQGGTLSWLTAAETMNIASDDANDTAGGTGARTIIIEGLDSAYNEISETVTLNGTTEVVTSNSYLRVNRMYVITSGSNETNLGNISAVSSGSSSSQATIIAGTGQTYKSQFTVPANKYAVITDLHISASRADNAEVVLKTRHEGESWRSRHTSYIFEAAANVPLGALVVPPKTDVKLTGVRLTGLAVGLACSYRFFLVDSEYVEVD